MGTSHGRTGRCTGRVGCWIGRRGSGSFRNLAWSLISATFILASFIAVGSSIGNLAWTHRSVGRTGRLLGRPGWVWTCRLVFLTRRPGSVARRERVPFSSRGLQRRGCWVGAGGASYQTLEYAQGLDGQFGITYTCAPNIGASISRRAGIERVSSARRAWSSSPSRRAFFNMDLH